MLRLVGGGDRLGVKRGHLLKRFRFSLAVGDIISCNRPAAVLKLSSAAKFVTTVYRLKQASSCHFSLTDLCRAS